MTVSVESAHGVELVADVTVIVVVYNNAPVISRCLEALAAQTIRPKLVLVVDNASTDGGAATLADTDALRVIRPGENLGFAGGNNLAARHASTPWIALLNPDAFPAPTWLAELLAAADRHPTAACFGSTQWLDSDPTRLDGAGDAYHASGIGYRRLNGRLGPPPDEEETFSPCAAAALYRREVFLEAGGFDERFFCYCEDLDLGFRIRALGYICIQAARAEVRHVGSSTTGRYSEFAVFHGVRNRLWLFLKNAPGPWVWILAPYVLLGTALHGASMAARGRGGTYVRALIAGLRETPRVWRDRAAVQAMRRASVGSILRAFTWSPLALLQRR